MFDKLTWQRKRRLENHNIWTNKYEKTPNGFLVRKYRNMLSRVRGIQRLKSHLYKDLDILPKKEFYEWSKSNTEFWDLFRSWKRRNHERRLCPTVNRIDPRKGYELSNMEWITHGKNSMLGAISKR